MANQFNNKLTRSVGTTSTLVYSTNSNTRATVIGINIANITPNTIYVDIIFVDGQNHEGYVSKNVEIASGTSLAAMGGDQKLVLVPNNSIKVVSSDANSVDVIVSALEITS